MKPKAKTLAERYGFRDPDLKTAKHDDIILWLMDKGNMYDVISEVCGGLDFKHYEPTGCIHGNLESYSGCDCPFINNGEKTKDENKLNKNSLFGGENTGIHKCLFEEEIAKEQKYIIEKLKQVSPEKVKEFYRECISINAEVPVTTDRNYVIGFIDLVVYIHPPSSIDGKKFTRIERRRGG